ncbi:MAG TPA: peptide-methionine (S)-S-oxide reductase [Helicobacteraceae bacterium]|nr:peptide-methionine (S)-S-oxide reductase [Helicobacteraceae bacterium]
MKKLVLISLLLLGSGLHAENIKSAYYAGGCFWGVEYHLEKQKGVIDAISGFMGGHVKNPAYYDVVRKDTGHIETVEVIYDADIISYERLTKFFFEIHDFEQVGGQGPDIGEQYISVVFYQNENEKKTAQKIIDTLNARGYKVATQLRQATPFYDAEKYHQDYYDRRNKVPYCHSYQKIF